MKSKYKIYLVIFLPCFLAGFFVLAKNISANAINDLIITEIMYDLDGSDTGREWIEIFNSTDLKISVPKNLLGIIDEREDRDTDGKLINTCHTLGSDLEIGSGEYIVIADNPTNFSKDYPNYSGKILDSVLSLNNTQSEIKISFDRCKTWVTSASYNKTMGAGGNKKTLELDLKNNAWQESYIDNGTPGTENFTGQDKKAELPPKEDSKIYSKELTLNEILPYPADGNEEFIELYNPDEKSIDLTSWILRDASKNGKYVLPRDTIIKAQNYLVIYKKDFKFALNNSGTESVTLFDPAEKIVSTTSYASAKENISYNFDGTTWRWSKSLTPGQENIFNNLPQVKNDVPKKVFVGAYADFFAKGSDKDNDKLKYTWDFGDGHKSYLQNTRHKYEKTGKYTVILKVSDGSEDEIKKFEIKVEKFPESNVKIISLSANPAGKDTGNEWIKIKNNTKKKINLKGWSIATGSKKKLINHPINLDLIVKPGKEINITQAYSKFTLNNKNSKVELRYPNGKVASKVKYASAEKSIAEGEIYEKTATGWTWKKPATAIKTEKVAPIDLAPEPEVLEPAPAENNPPEEIIPEPAIKDLGKFSPSPDWESKQKTRFSLLNSAFHIKTVSASFDKKSTPIASQINSEKISTQKHWATIFLENINRKINYFLISFF